MGSPTHEQAVVLGTADPSPTPAEPGTQPPSTPRPSVVGLTNLADGTRIGKYEVVKLLGRGGMGAVYRAFDPVLERDVALKVMRRQRRRATRSTSSASSARPGPSRA